MSLERRRPTLELTVSGSTLVEILADAKAAADAYFDGVSYEFTRCDATMFARAFDGQLVVYEAEVEARTVAADQPARGYVDPGTMFDPDDTEEVPIP